MSKGQSHSYQWKPENRSVSDRGAPAVLFLIVVQKFAQ